MPPLVATAGCQCCNCFFAVKYELTFLIPQGSSALWRPQWMEFPELLVRCDVVVRGPRLDEALGQLAG